jgi:hypothetical protein
MGNLRFKIWKDTEDHTKRTDDNNKMIVTDTEHQAATICGLGKIVS